MDTLSEIGSGISKGVGAVGNELGALPGQVSGLFGGGGSGGENPGAGAVNGTVGASAPAVMSPAGTGASGALPGASAGASGGLPIDIGQIAASAPAVDPVSTLSTQLTGAPSPDALTQGLAGASAPASGLPSAPPITTPSMLPLSAAAHAAAPTGAPLWEKAAGVALPFALNALAPQPGAGEIKQMKALQTEQQALAGENAAAGAAESQGKLPQPAQALIDRQLQERIAQIKNQYAMAGMSGSSAENADISAAKNDAVAQQFTIGNQLAQTALNQVASENNLSDSLLKGLYESEVGQSQQLQQLIQKMAGLLTTGAVPATKAA